MTYASVTISNYNATPPSDDGTQSVANRAYWSTVKTKLFDPLQTAVVALNTAIDDEIELIDSAFFTSGTAMVFCQTAAPTGWTKSLDTDHNDVTLRMVTGTAGSGGSQAFSSTFADRSFAISQAQLPTVNWNLSLSAADHAHSAGSLVQPAGLIGQTSGADISTVGGGETFLRSYNQGPNGLTVVWNQVSITGTSAASGAVAVDGTVSSGGQGTAIALDFNIAYQDFIIATMN